MTRLFVSNAYAIMASLLLASACMAFSDVDYTYKSEPTPSVPSSPSMLVTNSNGRVMVRSEAYCYNWNVATEGNTLTASIVDEKTIPTDLLEPFCRGTPIEESRNMFDGKIVITYLIQEMCIEKGYWDDLNIHQYFKFEQLDKMAAANNFIPLVVADPKTQYKRWPGWDAVHYVERIVPYYISCGHIYSYDNSVPSEMDEKIELKEIFVEKRRTLFNGNTPVDLANVEVHFILTPNPWRDLFLTSWYYALFAWVIPMCFLMSALYTFYVLSVWIGEVGGFRNINMVPLNARFTLITEAICLIILSAAFFVSGKEAFPGSIASLEFDRFTYTQFQALSVATSLATAMYWRRLRLNFRKLKIGQPKSMRNLIILSSIFFVAIVVEALVGTAIVKTIPVVDIVITGIVSLIQIPTCIYFVVQVVWAQRMLNTQLKASISAERSANIRAVKRLRTISWWLFAHAVFSVGSICVFIIGILLFMFTPNGWVTMWCTLSVCRIGTSLTQCQSMTIRAPVKGGYRFSLCGKCTSVQKHSSATINADNGTSLELNSLQTTSGDNTTVKHATTTTSSKMETSIADSSHNSERYDDSGDNESEA